MIYNKKIKLKLSEETGLLLDSQSKMCNWLYNRLLEAVEEDCQNGNKNNLLTGRNLRNEVPKIKDANPFLKKVHSSPLKNSALRLKDAYDRFFDKSLGNDQPKYRSWKKKWFSLYYDELNKGYKLLDENTLRISLGKRSDSEMEELKKKKTKAKRQLEITASLKESLKLEYNQKIKTLRITKELGSFYAIFTIEETIVPKHFKEKSFIVFDPNHQNLAVGIGSDGKTYEIVALTSIISYWDKRIDEIKSKRDQCERYSKLVVTEHSSYYKPSRRWTYLNKRLEIAYQKRREQIKLVLYRYAHFFSRQYDSIYIGDYTPTPDLASHKNMHRAMLNQSPIGQFRQTLQWVQIKNQKHYQKIEERDTTKTCAICGHQEKKDPSVRTFTCVNCGITLSRDLNAAANIAKKAKKTLQCSCYAGLTQPAYTVWWDYRRGKVSCGRTPSTENKDCLNLRQDTKFTLMA